MAGPPDEKNYQAMKAIYEEHLARRAAKSQALKDRNKEWDKLAAKASNHIGAPRTHRAKPIRINPIA